MGCPTKNWLCMLQCFLPCFVVGKDGRKEGDQDGGVSADQHSDHYHRKSTPEIMSYVSVLFVF